MLGKRRVIASISSVQSRSGYVVFAANGRMIVLLTAGGRDSAGSSSDMAALFTSMIAYTGTWSIDGDKVVTKVDGAWDPSLGRNRTSPPLRV